MMTTHDLQDQYDALALFSGGLDSILAAKLLEEQGLRVKCLHFVSPFFGKPQEVERWRRLYRLDISCVDISQQFSDMISQGPPHGFGKSLNPCVDCKILMVAKTKELMRTYGAFCIASGEVLGQRPMSQRRDTLNIIRRDAEVKDVLLRPLSAQRLDPTEVEERGLVDRGRLLAIGGRGRKEQLALAEKYRLPEIPTPAGGCLLAEVESAKRYWPVIRHATRPLAGDFALANVGRQYWMGAHWLVIGRNKADNQHLERMVGPADMVFKTASFPGPLGIGRPLDAGGWSKEVVHLAGAFLASFSPKARKAGGEVGVRVRLGDREEVVQVLPERSPLWQEPSWEEMKEQLRASEKGDYSTSISNKP